MVAPDDTEDSEDYLEMLKTRDDSSDSDAGGQIVHQNEKTVVKKYEEYYCNLRHLMTFVESTSNFTMNEKLLCTKCRKTCWHDMSCTHTQRADICFYHCPRCPNYNLCRDCYPTRHDFVIQCQKEVKEEVLAEIS